MPEGPELCFLGIYYNKLLKNQVFQEIISNTKSIVNLPSKSILKIYILMVKIYQNKIIFCCYTFRYYRMVSRK